MKGDYSQKQLHAFFQPFQSFYKQLLLLILFTLIHGPVYGELSCFAKGTPELREPESEKGRLAQEQLSSLLPRLREARVSQGVSQRLLTEFHQKGYVEFLYHLRKKNEDLYYLLYLLNENQVVLSLEKLRQYAVNEVASAQDQVHSILSELDKEESYRLLSNLVLSGHPNKLHLFLSELGSRELYERALSRFSEEEVESLRQSFEYRIRGVNANRSFVSSDIAGRSSMKPTEKNEDVSFVVIDLETTGLKYEMDEIKEIGAIRYVNGRPVEAFETLVRRVPDGEMIKVLRQEVAKLTGITDEMLKSQDNPTLDGVLEPLLQFLGTDHVVAHKAGFDVGFLRAAYERVNRSVGIFNEGTALYNEEIELHNEEHNTSMAPIEKVRKVHKPKGSIIDTLELSRRVFSDSVDSHALGNLVKFLGIDHGTLHRAKEDSYCCGEVLIHLLDRISSEADLTRSEVLEALADEEAGGYGTIVDRLLGTEQQE